MKLTSRGSFTDGQGYKSTANNLGEWFQDAYGKHTKTDRRGILFVSLQ